MRVACDIECDSLTPKHIWVIVCKDIDTGEYHVWRNVTENEQERQSFLSFAEKVTVWIWHNGLEFDYPVLNRLAGLSISDVASASIDTLVLSRLIDYPRKSHSIEDYGEEFGIPKGTFKDWSKYSLEMEDYCVRDVDICHRVYSKYSRCINDKRWLPSIRMEHQFQLVVNDLHSNGFSFNVEKASKLLAKVSSELAVLDKEILNAFPPKLKIIRQIDPKLTQHGTLHRGDFRWVEGGDLSEYNGGPFCRCSWSEFNPASHKQIIDVLHHAGWSPTDKTVTAIETQREIQKLKRSKEPKSTVDLALKALYDKEDGQEKYGWKISEANLLTLPPSAPAPAKTLARRILLEARRRTLTEWLGLVWLEIEIEPDLLGMLGIDKDTTLTPSLEINKEPRKSFGAQQTLKPLEPVIEKVISNILTDCPSTTLLEWLKHNKVNVQSAIKKQNSTSIIVIGQTQYEHFCAVTATAISDGTKLTPLPYKLISSRIHGKFNGLGAWSHRMNHQKPNTANIPNATDLSGKIKLYGAEMRSLWQAPKNRLLVGVDAEGIQLRIFAHYINDPEFTKALVEGRKDDKSDPHSLNQRILGSVCKTRAAAKRFIFALLLGAGIGKLAQILECSREEAEAALERIIERYEGFAFLKESIIPKDAKRGWFTGLDGRSVRIPGDTPSERRHLCMSGYLQNGEAVVMKMATLRWYDKLKDLKDWQLVNFVHDEWQTECRNSMDDALFIARVQCDALREVGEELGLKCPLAGSYYNDDIHDYTIGTNWKTTH